MVGVSKTCPVATGFGDQHSERKRSQIETRLLRQAYEYNKQGDTRKAEYQYRLLSQKFTTSAEVMKHAALFFATNGHFNDARSCLLRAHHLNSADIDIQMFLLRILCEGGYWQEGIKHSLQCFRDSTDSEVYGLMGLCYWRLGRIIEARECLVRAATAENRFAPASMWLSALLIECGEFEELIRISHQYSMNGSARYLQPYTHNLAIAYICEGNYDKAKGCIESIKQKTPADHLLLAWIALIGGDYNKGMKLYEWRLKDPKIDILFKPRIPVENSVRTPSAEHIIVVCEQGFGDTVQYARYIPLLEQYYKKITVVMQDPLHSLLSVVSERIHIVSPNGFVEPDNAVCLPLMSIPLKMDMLDPYEPTVPYLQIPDSRIRNVQSRYSLNKLTRKLVGLCWQGNPSTEKILHRNRSMPFWELLPILELDNVDFVSLQKIHGVSAPADSGVASRFIPKQEAFTNDLSFMNTAAMICQCTYIVTVDTVIAHIAGALGIPTLLLLKKYSDWRWGMKGLSTPWYSSVRILRQENQGCWHTCINNAIQVIRQIR